MITEELSRNIAAETLCSLGTGIAWQKLLRKKSLRVGFIGGSVTMGFVKDHVQEEAYPSMFCDSLRTLGYEAEAIVCAEPGMSTMHGNLLAEEQLLSKKPDLVFVEFSINETTLRPSVVSFESLLRKLLTAPDAPAVCFFLLRNVNDYHCESYMMPIAEHYGLPCIRLRTGLNPALERGKLKWADYADEESHPNPEGHRMLADCLLHFWNAAAEQKDSEPLPLPEPWLDAPFSDMRYLHPARYDFIRTDAEIVPRWSMYFPEAWKLTRTHSVLEITLTCRTLFIFYEVNHLPEYGSAHIRLDGLPLESEVLHGNSMYGWGNTRFFAPFSGDVPQTHTVTLEAADGDFYIPALGICE